MKDEPRCGDVVEHGPTGERWVVAWCEDGRLAWFGWPNGRADLSDCEVVERVSDEKHREMVQAWADSRNDDGRKSTVLRLYGHALATPDTATTEVET